MEESTPTMGEVMTHVAWIIQSHWMVRRANQFWSARRPYRGDTLMDVGGLNHWLYRWAVETGRLPDDGGRPGLFSQEISKVYRREPEAVEAEARAYYKLLVAEHT